MTLFYVPLEAIQSRYTWQWSAPEVGWLERNWRRYGVEYTRVNGDQSSVPSDIRSGVVLDAVGRSVFCFSQVAKLLRMAERGEIKDSDVIYFDDFWTPGFLALPYAFHLLGVRPRMYAFLHAQSVDEFDFTASMRHWMRPAEIAIARSLDGILVCCPTLRDLVIHGGIAEPSKVHVTGHPFNSEEVLERFPKCYREWHEKGGRPPYAHNHNPSGRDNTVIWSSRWDAEKDPLFFLKVAEEVIMGGLIPGVQFVVCTSSTKLRSNDERLRVAAKEACERFPNNFFVKADLTKEAYYAELCQAKVQFNCLGGNTLVVTKDGARPIRKLVGRVELMTEHGRWQESEVKSYGVQKVLELTFGRGPNNTFVVKATADHRWYLANGRVKTTSELRHGDMIAQVAVQPSIQSDDDYLKGVMHGIVFGDGTARKSSGGFAVRLCGHKKELLRFFEEFPYSYPPSCNGDPIVYIRGTAAWSDLKALPYGCSTSYLVGFFRGWLATDGHVCTTHHNINLSGTPENMEWARRHAMLVGWHPTNIVRRVDRTVRVNFYADTISDADILLRCKAEKLADKPCRSRAYIFKSAVAAGEEEVYCAEVPETHNFVLWNGMLTGNCALQDFVPITLQESSVGGCFPLYPYFRSMPESLLWDPRYLYDRGDVGQAAYMLTEVLRRDDLWTHDEVMKRSWIHRRFDTSWVRMLQKMGVDGWDPSLPPALRQEAAKDPFDRDTWVKE